MGKPQFDYDASELRRMYVDEQMSANAISQAIGCNDGTVKRCLIRNGIAVRSFADSCKTDRRRQAIRLSKIGVKRPNISGELNWRRGGRSSGRQNRSGRPGSRWSQATIKKDTGSYRTIKVRGVSFQQHRLVAQAVLGRHLTNTEEVHHVNGCRSDNRPANLWVFPTGGAHMAFHKSGTIHPETIKLTPYTGEVA